MCAFLQQVCTYYFKAQATSVSHITTAVPKYSNTDIQELLGSAVFFYMQTFVFKESGNTVDNSRNQLAGKLIFHSKAFRNVLFLHNILHAF